MSSTTETICRDVLGLTPRKVQRVRAHLDRVTTDKHVVFIKSGRAAATGGKFALEAWAYDQCRKQGVRVPEVLSASSAGEDLDYVATVALAGRALWVKPWLSEAASKRVLRAAGEQLRTMHEIKVDGAGTITGSPPRGGDDYWCAFVDISQRALPGLVESGILTAGEAAAVEARFTAAAPAIPRDVASRLLHGDLEGDHIFSYRGAFTGFLDFEKMLAGDPVYDLARFAWWDRHLFAYLLEGYGRDALTDEDIELRMPAYIVANAIGRGEQSPNRKSQSVLATQRARSFILEASKRNFRELLDCDHPPTLQGSDGDGRTEILVAGVRGKSDEQIVDFANEVGGFAPLCGLVFSAWKGRLRPDDYSVGLALGEGINWIVSGTGGKVTVNKGDTSSAAVAVRMSPQDFLRLMVNDLDIATAAREGRARVRGDGGQLRNLFASR